MTTVHARFETRFNCTAAAQQRAHVHARSVYYVAQTVSNLSPSIEHRRLPRLINTTGPKAPVGMKVTPKYDSINIISLHRNQKARP